MTHGAVVIGGKLGVFLVVECALVWFLVTRSDLGEASDWSDVFSVALALGTAANGIATAALSRVVGDGPGRPAQPSPYVLVPGTPLPPPDDGLRAMIRRVFRHPALTAAMVVVALVLVAGTVWLVTRVHAQNDVARADAIAFRSQQEAGRDPALANVLAAEALGRRRTPVTWAAAMAALALPMHDSVTVTSGSSAVETVAASPDGTLVAAPATDYTVRLWDTQSGREVGTLVGPDDRITALAFSSDGGLIAGGSADGTVRLWDVDSRKALGSPKMGHLAAVTAVAFEPRTAGVVSAGADGRVQFWRPDSDRPDGDPLVAQQAEGVRSFALSADGTHLVTGSTAGRVRVWDVADRELVRELPGRDRMPITGIAFSPDGRRFASASADREIRVWDGETLREQRALTGHSLAVLGVGFSGSGNQVVSGGQDGTVRLWDLRGSRQVAPEVLTGHQGAVRAAMFLSDGRIVSAGDDGTLRLWAASSARVLGQPLVDPADASPVNAVAFAPDGRTLVAASDSGNVRFWDARTRRPRGPPLPAGEGIGVAVAFTDAGRRLLTGDEDGTVRVWDADTHDLLEVLGPAPGAVKIWGMAVSPDGRTVATAGDDGVVRLWDRPGHRLRDELPGHAGAAQQVAFAHDGRSLVSTGEDGAVLLWDLTRHPPSSVPLQAAGPHAAWGVAFAPDDALVAVASADRRVRLWDPYDRSMSGAPLEGHTDAVDDVAFNRDGTLVATTSGDSTVRVWDAVTREMIGAPLTGHRGWVDGLAFSPHDDTLATTGDDGTVRLWDLDRDGWHGQLCRRAARNLSPDEWLAYVDRDPTASAEPTCPSG